MSLRRLTVALLLFTFDISPLCDVAQTSDCGTHCLLFSHYKPFMWCRLAARLRHCYSCIFLLRSHSDTRLALSIYFGISGGLPPDFSFISHATLSLCLNALVNLFICFMFTFVISYVRTVLRVLS